MAETDHRSHSEVQDQRPEQHGDLMPGIRHVRTGEPGADEERLGPRPWTRYAPFVQLLAYYVVLVALVALLVWLFPAVRRAFFAPVLLPSIAEGEALFTGMEPGAASTTTDAQAVTQAMDRALTTVLVILGALTLVVPVTWVYMRTKRLRYDPALVRSVVILPVVVAGIALVVKNSIALAFSLAGIVAAVRFRNTLKDPQDAVYIFLTIGIGLSAGIQALDVALVMSLIFNFVVLILWRFNIGSVFGSGYARTGVIYAGDPSMLLAQTPEARRRIRLALLDEAEEMDTDGVLLVHADDVEMARHAVQDAMSELAKEWRLAGVVPRNDGLTTLEYLVQLRKKTSPTELVGALDEKWSALLRAAEYFSFRARERERDAAAAEPEEE